MGNSLSDLLAESERTIFEDEFLELVKAYNGEFYDEDRADLEVQLRDYITAEADIRMRVMMILFISNITTEEARNDLIQWLHSCGLLNFKNTSAWQIEGVAAQAVPVIGEQQYDWLLGELKGSTSLENAEWLSASLNEQTGKPEWPLTVHF